MGASNMTKAAAIQKFFEDFGLTAYEENSVPVGAKFPYLTYPLTTDSFGERLQVDFSLWYRSDLWSAINAKTEYIAQRIGRGGETIDCDDGCIYIFKGSPFAQSMGDPSDDKVKRKVISLEIEFITLN
jgi:hypothetical protein